MNPSLETNWQVGWGVPGGEPVVWALGLAFLLAALYGSRLGTSPLGRARRSVLVGLRWLTAAAAFVLAAQPVLWLERQRTEPGALAVVIDASRSMGVATGDDSRLARASALVRRWLDSPRASEAQWYVMGESLTAVDREQLLARLSAQAPGTHLVQGLTELAQTEGLGAIAVISDGSDTTGAGVPPALGTRVHAVHVPDTRALRDDTIASLQADPVAFLHGEAKVQATIASQGLGVRQITVMLKRADQVLTSKVVQVPAEGETKIELGFSPRDLGREAYSIEIPIDADDDVPENNRRAFLVRVTRDRLRVLHVSGRPSWDQRFLRGFLKRDPSVDLISFFILRSVHDLTMSRPSELALIPFPTDELFRQHLTSFDVVIMQDFDYAPYQMASYLPLIRDYVKKGGGLAMIGGELSFDGGGYGETAIADVLPVRMPPASSAGAAVVEGAFSPRPVTSYLHHPLLELFPDAAQTLAAFRSLEPLVGINALRGPTERGVVLLEHPSARGEDDARLPLLTVGTFGRGRSLALATDTSWHWSMPTAGRGGDPSAYDRFWDRAVRWLTRDPLLDASRLTTQREAYGPGAALNVSGILRDPRYQPIGSSDIRLAVQSLTGEVQSQAQARSDGNGAVKAELRAPREPGIYHVIASRDGVELARALFLVELSGVELSRPDARAAMLQSLSRATGGSFSDQPESAPELHELDVSRTTSLGTERRAPLGAPSWAGLLFGLIAIEWVLRRRWGER